MINDPDSYYYYDTVLVLVIVFFCLLFLSIFPVLIEWNNLFKIIVRVYQLITVTIVQQQNYNFRIS